MPSLRSFVDRVQLLNPEAPATIIDLPRADVFSLGASVYELLRARELPKRDEVRCFSVVWFFSVCWCLCYVLCL